MAGTALLGVATDGVPLMIRLASPDVTHVLITGVKGSGKTEAVKAILASLVLYQNHREIQLLLIDPKATGFEFLTSSPHLLGDIATTPEACAQHMRWLESELERRENQDVSRPRLVVVVDELADLVMHGGREFQVHLARLAQRGRASGISLIVCNNKVNATDLNSGLRSHFPVRLAGKSASGNDGAERLLARGEFILMAGGERVRFQSAYLAPEDIPAFHAQTNANLHVGKHKTDAKSRRLDETSPRQIARLPRPLGAGFCEGFSYVQNRNFYHWRLGRLRGGLSNSRTCPLRCTECGARRRLRRHRQHSRLTRFAHCPEPTAPTKPAAGRLGTNLSRNPFAIRPRRSNAFSSPARHPCRSSNSSRKSLSSRRRRVSFRKDNSRKVSQCPRNGSTSNIHTCKKIRKPLTRATGVLSAKSRSVTPTEILQRSPIMAVKPIPDGFHSVTPHITIKGAAHLMDFFKAAFGAQERNRTEDANGRIANAEMKIGDSIVMIAEATEKYPPMPSAYYLYVPDTDATYKSALKAGATSLMEPADQFYGDRNAGIQDPSGNQWWIATHVEDVSPQEMERRAQEWRDSSK